VRAAPATESQVQASVLNEFELIRRYFSFSRQRVAAPDVGIGDDCALLSLPPGQQLAISTDTLVSGVHFPETAEPSLLARRALRVNLSDLAAMAASPRGFQLALTLPSVEEDWLRAFSSGLAQDAEAFGCALLGGDTTRGPLSLTITILGEVPTGRALLRSGAQAGDDIYVSGTLGDAAMALDYIDRPEGAPAFFRDRYYLPQPRLELARLLRRYASAALDVSDGLLQDLGHIVATSASQSGESLSAHLEMETLPLSPEVIAAGGLERARQCALQGGDDYEICFTAPVCYREAVRLAGREAGVPVHLIGRIQHADEPAIVVVDSDGQPIEIQGGGYDHFGIR
jgi:thiamine-monophosphate kinase